MAEEIGSLAVKIGLDSSGFQNGVSNINRELRVLDSEFKASNAALGENAKGFDGLKLKSESLSKQLELQKQKVTALDGAYNKSVETKGKDSRATEELEIKLNRAKQTLSQMENELSKTNKQIETQSSKWTTVGNKFNSIGGKMQTVGEGFSSVGNKLSLGVTAPLVAAGTAATKMAMDAVESENLFEVSMGNMAGSARKWSEDLSKSLGLNAYEVRNNVATFNVMLNSMGLTEQASYDMSTSLTKLAYDMASFYNLKPEEAFEKLRAGISGETEPLKALGINISDTAVNTYALQQGLAKQGHEMTEQEKITARFGLIMQSTSKAQGDLGRTMDSPTNKIRTMKQQAEQLGIQFGQVLIPVLETLMATIKPIMDTFLGLSKGQQELIVKIGLMVAALGPVLSIVGKIITVGGSLASIFGKASTAIGAAGGAMKILTGPVGIAVIAITGLVAVGVLLYKNWDTIKAKATQLWQGITTTFNNIKTSITNVWENVKTSTINAWNNLKATITNGLNSIKSFLQPALDFIKNIFESVWDAIKNIVLGAVLIVIDVVTGNFTKLKSDIENIWNNIKTALTNIWEAIKNVAVNAWNSLKQTVINLCNNIKQGIINIWNSILSWFSELPSKLYTHGANMFSRMREGVSSTIGNVKSTIVNGINNAIDFIKNIPSKMYSWGKDMIQGLVNGIKSMIGSVGDAVSGVGNKIRSLLHFSVPDEGPLTDYESWMPDFMSGLAQGINKSKSLVVDAIKSLSVDMKINPEVAEMASFKPKDLEYNKEPQNNNGITLYIENFINNTDKDIEQIAYELEFYRQRVSLGKGGV